MPRISSADRESVLARVWQVLRIRAPMIADTLLGNLRVGHALPKHWRERYRRARADMLAADPIFHPSRQWMIVTALYRALLRGRGVRRFKSTFGRFLAAYEPHNPIHYEALHHLYASALRPRDAWGLLDTLEEPELGEGVTVKYRGKRLSLDLLQAIDEFNRIREAHGFTRQDRVVFCEIGAGYGRLANVVLSTMPNATYLIFDLSESLLLSQYYLTTLHPDWKVALYPESASVLGSSDAIRAHRVCFGPPHAARLVPPGVVDVFINIYSFMEMGRKQIETYFDIIEGLRAKTLYLKQHKRELAYLDNAINTIDNYPIRPSWKELFRETSTLFDHVFEAAYDLGNRK